MIGREQTRPAGSNKYAVLRSKLLVVIWLVILTLNELMIRPWQCLPNQIELDLINLLMPTTTFVPTERAPSRPVPATRHAIQTRYRPIPPPSPIVVLRRFTCAQPKRALRYSAQEPCRTHVQRTSLSPCTGGTSRGNAHTNSYGQGAGKLAMVEITNFLWFPIGQPFHVDIESRT